MIPLTRQERVLLRPTVHLLAGALMFIGLRDRLRCPECSAVGTFKPHGWFPWDHEDRRGVRRWMCKWCGYYIGPEGRMWCVVDPELRVWREPEAVPDGYTPARAIAESPIPNVWPWRG